VERGGEEIEGRGREGRGWDGRHLDEKRLVVSPLVHDNSYIVDVALSELLRQHMWGADTLYRGR